MRKTMVVLSALLAVAVVSPAQARMQKGSISAGTTLTSTSCSGISINGYGSDPNRIASSEFTLGVLNPDGSTTLVDSKTFVYSTPLPRDVAETWNSTTQLVPGVTYRVVFRIFERSGISPAAAGGDFTCT